MQQSHPSRVTAATLNLVHPSACLKVVSSPEGDRRQLPQNDRLAVGSVLRHVVYGLSIELARGEVGTPGLRRYLPSGETSLISDMTWQRIVCYPLFGGSRWKGQGRMLTERTTDELGCNVMQYICRHRAQV